MRTEPGEPSCPRRARDRLESARSAAIVSISRDGFRRSKLLGQLLQAVEPPGRQDEPADVFPPGKLAGDRRPQPGRGPGDEGDALCVH